MMLHFNPSYYGRKRKDMAEIIGGLIGILIALAILLISPFITIWAINMLFATQIGYGVGTYFATLWLTSLIAVRYRGKS